MIQAVLVLDTMALGRKLCDLYEKRGEIFEENKNSLYGYIILAEQEGLLDEQYIRYANEIRFRTNHVLHNDAGLTATTKDTIQKTAQLIAKIETGKDPFIPDL